MGYNTVAFLLNDFMHELEKSPKAAMHGLCHPPCNDSQEAVRRWRQEVASVAKAAGEPIPHSQALQVLGTFHADHTQWLVAGGNCIMPLTFLRYGSTKEGELTVTLVLPEGWASHPRSQNRGGRSTGVKARAVVAKGEKRG